MEMRLVHMHPVLQWLKFMKQDQAYVQLYKSDKKNACSMHISVLVRTQSFRRESTQSFMHLTPAHKLNRTEPEAAYFEGD